MGGGLKADLSQGAVRALWGAPAAAAAAAEPGRPAVLQVVGVRHAPDGAGLRPAASWYPRYRLLLSDGVYSQYAKLAPCLNHLIAASGARLRRGSVVRVLSFVPAPDPDHVRTIVILELKILQTKCALIGSLKFYKLPRNPEV